MQLEVLMCSSAALAHIVTVAVESTVLEVLELLGRLVKVEIGQEPAMRKGAEVSETASDELAAAGPESMRLETARKETVAVHCRRWKSRRPWINYHEQWR